MRTWACLTAALFLTACAAQEEPREEIDPRDFALGEPKRCVQLLAIDRMRVIDDQNILVYMKGDELYLNHLPRRCAGLRPRSPLSYETSMNQLCEVDLITVLENTGLGLSRRATCGLGAFYPVSEPDVEPLLEKSE